MGNNQTKPSSASISRRTGIDRRWIPSIGYYPERRRGKDRRSNQKRSFLTPIDSTDEDSRNIPFPNDHSNRKWYDTNRSESVISEKSASRAPDTVLADEVSDS
jgi:hypothetical protein